jgi:2-polyprenyl-3-methyl-5-hydroxy-6-metoxy-1,4-benzoquinol methylase
MSKDRKRPRLVKTKWGFYQYEPKPSEAELEKYYAKKYFQEGHGGYDISYTKEELEWYKLKSWLIYREVEKLISLKKGSLIDIGCGEGWLLNEFYSHGWSVIGMDFGRYAIEKYHPHLLAFFQQGNIYKLMKQKIKEGKKFDVIFLGNVIEHVINPVGLLNDIRPIMHKHSVLIMVVPNDFSPLQKHLIDKKYITKKWWLAYPDHLSYFNKQSMSNLVQDLGFQIKMIVAENPIDLNILNDNSNYISDASKGKNIHRFRVRTDNFLASVDREKTLCLYEILGSMGIGRGLIYYCQRNSKI